MADHRDQISELADIMQEFGLSEARISVGDLSVGFKKRPTVKTVVETGSADVEDSFDEIAPVLAAAPAQRHPNQQPNDWHLLWVAKSELARIREGRGRLDDRADRRID